MDIETMGENKFYWVEHGCLHAFLSKKIPGNNCAQARVQQERQEQYF